MADRVAERRDKVLRGLEVGRLRGLEIGPLSHPLVWREDGPVLYVYHATTAELKVKNAGHPDIDVEAIVEVDAVWGDRTLKQCLDGREVDYVVASHVIEHVPDLITWLQEIEEALAPTGQLRLIAPDKRFTFDLFRRPTSLADLLVAHLMRARRPGLQQVVDFALNTVYAESGWVRAGKVTTGSFTGNNGKLAALSTAERFLRTDDYIDLHCWAFSPADFARLFQRASGYGLIRFRCAGFFDTEPGEHEFVVHLEKCADPDACAASWADMAGTVAASPMEPFDFEDGAAAVETVAELKRLLAARTAELAAVRNSRTWRATGPLRAMLTALRPRRR